MAWPRVTSGGRCNPRGGKSSDHDGVQRAQPAHHVGEPTTRTTRCRGRLRPRPAGGRGQRSRCGSVRSTSPGREPGRRRRAASSTLSSGSIVATPQLALVFISPTACASIVRRSRSAKRCAPARSVSGRTTTNSSPPQRATVSPWRASEVRRRLTARSITSPAAWPKESLISLKRSRSSSTTASWWRKAVGAGDLGSEDLLERATIREPGERVDPGLARLLLRPAERAQQGAGEHERQQHQRHERQQPRLDHADVRRVLPVRHDRRREIGADADPRRQRQRHSSTCLRRRPATDVRELHSLRGTRRQLPEQRLVGGQLRDDRADLPAAADELSAGRDGVLEPPAVAVAVGPRSGAGCAGRTARGSPCHGGRSPPAAAATRPRRPRVTGAGPGAARTAPARSERRRESRSRCCA